MKGVLYLDGHINPSASCTMVLTDKLTLHDTFYGWVVGSFKDGRAAYERCCADHPPADCGDNRNCMPELFENSIGKVTVNDAKDSITFKARFDDIPGPSEVIYSISHLRQGKPKVRERPAGGRTASGAPPP